MLELAHIYKRYHRYAALEDISFSIAAGQVVGLLGRNGAGKSTTMNILTGYLAPTSGRVLWDGRDALRMGGEYLAEVGYLPEIPPLYSELTVRESLEFACGLKRIRRDQRKRHIEQLCELTSVTDCLRTPTRSLSKGYRQRVGLAQALIGNPSLLVLDEPTVGLDPEQIVSIRELIRSLGRDHAILLSSHILSEIEDVCTSLVILRKGRIVASGTTAEIAAKARSAGHRVRVRARGDGARQALLGLPGVTAVEPLPEREGGYQELMVAAGQDIAALIPRALEDAGASLRRRYPMDVELEDVFMNVTREESDNG